jgi:hypothetical protein
VFFGVFFEEKTFRWIVVLFSMIWGGAERTDNDKGWHVGLHPFPPFAKARRMGTRAFVASEGEQIWLVSIFLVFLEIKNQGCALTYSYIGIYIP